MRKKVTWFALCGIRLIKDGHIHQICWKDSGETVVEIKALFLQRNQNGAPWRPIPSTRKFFLQLLIILLSLLIRFFIPAKSASPTLKKQDFKMTVKCAFCRFSQVMDADFSKMAGNLKRIWKSRNFERPLRTIMHDRYYASKLSRSQTWTRHWLLNYSGRANTWLVCYGGWISCCVAGQIPGVKSMK